MDFLYVLWYTPLCIYESPRKAIGWKGTVTSSMQDAKLYVGNLSYGTTEQTLSDHFAQAGTVASATIIKDKMTGRSKGFGFVEMSSAEEAQKAIEMFHEKDFDGRPLTVNVARPLAERPPRREGGFDRGNSRW